ncbi:hypothetical protein EAG_03113 [Camponotus floridanus]|uniref:Uncharacterized protein n=1 Tax=Camponotus floridanus TaxID=104421 RepID=E2ABM1_CAMFO|nr:hypothetical protein EAG_03113 [Camponotus floridanus]
MNDSGFIIAEFDDGLQLIPTIWFNAEKQSCIWPGHFKTKFRINKAIITKEIPQEEFDWDELPIKRIFGTAEAVRTMYGSVTDNEIAESISKWLTQASLRTQRERQQNTQTELME